uniref:Uncharacterized protein n=1 Tax=Graphocephala atropunctata TaxID=36148 RepID=A0A1B6MIF8_9HEMI
MAASCLLVILSFTLTTTIADVFDDVNFTAENVANFHQLFVSLLQKLGFNQTSGLLQLGDSTPLAQLEERIQTLTSSTGDSAPTADTSATRAIMDAPTRTCRPGQSRDLKGNCRSIFG